MTPAGMPALPARNANASADKRSILRRLGDHRTTGRQGRSDLARQHGDRKVPRSDGGRDPHRFFGDDDPASMSRLGNHIAVDSLGLFCKPLDIGRAIGHLAPAFAERFALFERDQPGQIFPMLPDHRQPSLQMLCPLFRQQRTPTAEGPLRRADGGLGFDRTAIRQCGQNRTIGGIFYGKRASIARSCFLVIDPGMVEDQFTAFELQHRVSLRQQTMKIQEMFFAHVAQLLIDMLGRQVVVGGSQGKPLGAGAARKLFRIA